MGLATSPRGAPTLERNVFAAGAPTDPSPMHRAAEHRDALAGSHEQTARCPSMRGARSGPLARTVEEPDRTCSVRGILLLGAHQIGNAGSPGVYVRTARTHSRRLALDRARRRRRVRGVLGEEGSGAAGDAPCTLPAVAGAHGVVRELRDARAWGRDDAVVRGQRMHEDVGGDGVRGANRTASCEDAAGVHDGRAGRAAYERLGGRRTAISWRVERRGRHPIPSPAIPPFVRASSQPAVSFCPPSASLHWPVDSLLCAACGVASASLCACRSSSLGGVPSRSECEGTPIRCVANRPRPFLTRSVSRLFAHRLGPD